MADEVPQSSESVPQMEEKSQVEKPRLSIFIVLSVCTILTVVLVANGMVPLRDVLFVGFATVYFVLFGKYVYPCPITKKPLPRILFPMSRLMKRYIAFASLIAIYAVVAYIIGSFIKGDLVAVNAAAPPLFLLAIQVLSENISVYLPTPVSLPVRMMIPLFYNTRRLFTISTWLDTEFARTTDNRGWLFFGRGLAIANMAFWTFNLFGFLLPVFVPYTMKEHGELERSSKEA